ncbi:MAG: FAD binding domain-containing protein [Candidatus Izimaplasma sp.]|nr:FAD binding domain-containing protein [Candidatus Izimaplasma bacterium]
MVDGLIAKSLNEALEALDNKEYQIVAGGTDMLIQNRSHSGMNIDYKKDVLYINLIDELDFIKVDEKNLYIGANTRLETILESKLVPQILRDVVIEMASPGIRHTATLAGNIGNASPAGDSLVVLYLLDCELEIKSLTKTRKVLLKDFITGVRKIALNKNELITKLIIPKINLTDCYFHKVGPRLSDAISKLSFACGYSVENSIIKDLRVAFGAVYVTVVRSREVEGKFIGQSVNDLKANLDDIINAYEPLIKPIDDQRSNRVYRKNVAINLLREFIENIKED